MTAVVIDLYKPEPDDPTLVKCCVCGNTFDVDCDDVYPIGSIEELWICDNCLEEVRTDK